jgi:uncharacterized protein YndB with AHSA1/START domain
MRSAGDKSLTIQTDGKATTTRSAFRIEVAVGITIQAAPATIWALLTNAQNFSRWNSTVQSIQGKIAPGETILLRATIAPERTFKLHVTAFAPNERMIWQDGTPLFRGIRQYALIPRSDGATDITMAETLSGPMLPMIAGSLPDQGPSFERFLVDLKAEAEHGA